ncbi:hypothetical protein FPOA_03374 [Fusarium poae]|uniref:VWFA domain-containing protein n=1 Tax=Fusarium poae TaxID=36050 RepID=A0A1B8B9Q3_FUSPO|nr:hypothetical protein FPOA_03374 [Fusarium poae]
MSSRHVPIKRLPSGVLISAPDLTQRFPPDEASELPMGKPNNILRTPRARGIESVDDVHTGISHISNPLAMFVTYGGCPDYVSPPSSNPGVPFVPPKEEKAMLYLPVLKVSSITMIEGTLAYTTLIQSFRNPSQMTISEARHMFPLYDGAVVTGFECTIGDERRLRGVVKSKEQARKEYKKAVQEQAKAAAILEEHTPEMFETSLGNIPPMTTVEIKIVYIQELRVVMMDGEATEGVAFIVPTSIAPRHDKSQSASEITRDGLDIKIRILNDGKVNPDGCQEESGHEVYYDGSRVMEPPQKFDGNGEQSPQEYYCWDHHSDQSTMTKDFVFVIQMRKGHEVQSQAILCPPDDAGLAAMMVSIRPSDLFRNAIIPQSFSGEILFLLDQSGSMRWGDRSSPGGPGKTRKIDILREAMLLVISGLPKTCSFNIISWGSETWAMWEHSRKQSPDNINEAKEYISQIEANLGGTDLLRALKSAVQRRQVDSNSTQIVVLTDGELNPNEPMSFVWKTRQELQNKIRFFALGIGSKVPHSLIEGITDLGGGFGDIIDTTKNPRWHSRLNRLFKSSLEPDSWDCDINIGHEFEQHSLVDFRLNKDTSDTQKVPYFQAPHTITALHPFKFTSIFFLIKARDDGVMPSEITITTTTNGAKKKMYRLSVTQAAGQDGTMHRLAAKAALVDLEDLVKNESSSSPLVEENAQTIGTTYSITSKWTSFVAVPQDEPTTTTTEGTMMEHYKAMYEDVGFEELLATADLDRDGDTKDVRGLGAVDYALVRRQNSTFLYGSTAKFKSRRGPPGLLSDISNKFSTVDERPSSSETMVRNALCSDVIPPQGGGEASRSEVETVSNKERAVSPDADEQIPSLRSVADPRASPSPMDLLRQQSMFPDMQLSLDMSLDSLPDSSDLQSAPLATTLDYPELAETSTSERSGNESRSRDQAIMEKARELHAARITRQRDGGASSSDLSNANFRMNRRPRARRQKILPSHLPPPLESPQAHPQDVRDKEERAMASPREVIDPLNWKVAVEYQNGQSLFELPESARGLLHLHFCPDTVLAAIEKLNSLLPSQERSQGASEAVVIDTIMTILCYQTHLALEEDLWDLMMERARDAVTETIGQEILETIEEFLTASMMHKHYTVVVEGNGSEGGQSTGTATCPVCNVQWQSLRTFSCPFDHEPDMPHVFQKWAEFWEHQKEKGHMGCPRE